jgi:hypothetical protein
LLFAWLAGAYKPDKIWRHGIDYERLMRGGFLLEYTAGDCMTCMENIGLCQINTTYDIFVCCCSDGVSPSII